MKTNIAKMLVVHKKDGRSSVKTFDRPMLGFWDSKKVGAIANEIFRLMIIATIGKF